MGSSYHCFDLKVPATSSFAKNNISQRKKKKTVTQLAVTTLILLLIHILFNIHEVPSLKDAECYYLTYVDPKRTELGNDNVLPFQLSKLFSPLCAANLTAGKWKVIPTRGL